MAEIQQSVIDGIRTMMAFADANPHLNGDDLRDAVEASNEEVWGAVTTYLFGKINMGPGFFSAVRGYADEIKAAFGGNVSVTRLSDDGYFMGLGIAYRGREICYAVL